jgi:hypothetical protein
MKFSCTKLVQMERETLKVYVGILRSRVVTLFAARGDMRENGGHRRQESLLLVLMMMMNFCVGLHVHLT